MTVIGDGPSTFGDHMLEPERIMGVTPTAAAIVVRKIGRNLRSPASMAALLSFFGGRKSTI
jgi:hypothetical protein